MSATPSPVKEGEERTVESSSPTKPSTPCKVPEVTVAVTESPVSKDPSKDGQTVDTGPTPPITPDREAAISSAGVKGVDSKDSDGQDSEKPKSVEDTQVVVSGTESGDRSNESGKKDSKKNDGKKKTPKKSPSKQSPSKSPKEKGEENQDASSVKAEDTGCGVKEGESEEGKGDSVKKEGRGSESDQKGPDATSTTSTGGVQTSGSEDMTGKAPKRTRKPRPPRKPRAEDGGLVNPPFKHNLPPKEGEEGAISAEVKGKDPAGQPADPSKPADKRSPRGGFQRRGPRGYRGGYRGDRPGMFVARDTKPRPIKSDESAPDGENKKPSTSEGGPTEGSGTETDKPAAVQQRKRNRNRPRRRKSGSRNREEGQEEGGQSDTQNGYSSYGEGKAEEKSAGGQEARGGQPARRRRGPRGPKKNPDGASNQREEGEDGDLGTESQSNQSARREGGGWGRGRGYRGWNRPRGFGPRGGGGGWNNDHRQPDGRHNDSKLGPRDHGNVRRDDERGYQRRSDNYGRDHGYHDNQRPFNRRDMDESRSGGYGPRSYGNSNYGRGGGNFGSSSYDRTGSFGASDRGNQGYQGSDRGNQGYQGSDRGNQGYQGSDRGNQGGYERGRSSGFRGGYNESRNRSSYTTYSASRSIHHDRNTCDVTPIDVVKITGQSTNINTHQGGFWN